MQPHVLNVCFPGVDSEAAYVGTAADKLAISNGAACTSSGHSQSHVLASRWVLRAAAATRATAVRLLLGPGRPEQIPARRLDQRLEA